MKLTVIGSGSAGNCYVLEGRDSALIIECGVSPERVFRETSVRPSKVAGCLVSHEHGDHAGFVDRFADLGMDIYASRGTILARGLARHGSRVHALANLVWYSVGGFSVAPFDVVHDAAEPFGFLVEHPECGKVLFVTDTRYVPLTFRSHRVDHILVEANYSDDIIDDNVYTGRITGDRANRVRMTHLSLRSACEFVEANETGALKTVVLLHLSGGNADPDAFARIAAKSAPLARVYVAVGGLSIELKKNEI